jgi:phosphonatase-like hydrolase
MHEIELVILDLAGTTVKDQGQVPKAFTTALTEAGILVTSEQINALRGASKRQALLTLLPDTADRSARAEQVYRAFCEHLAQDFAEGIDPVSGATETMTWLRERGVRVVLNTGFDRDITNLLLSSLGWSQGVVDAVICTDDVRQGRPAPYMIFRAMEASGTWSVHRVVNVGDTKLDLQAGYNAGVGRNIGVLTGAHTPEQLEQVPHTHILTSVRELPTLWSTA